LLLARRLCQPGLSTAEFWGKPFESTRKQAGLTQEKLAERADFITTSSVRLSAPNMETSLTSMVKIAKALDVRVRDLVADL